MCKTAVLLAGGLGRRLQNLTTDVPKSLLPIKGSPLLEIIMRQLSSSGFKRVILAIHHLGDLIKSFCKDGSQWNIAVEYVQEKKPLGTIGPIKLLDTLPDDFLIMNTDVLTDIDLTQFHDLHVQERNLFTIATFEETEESPYGVLKIQNHRLVGFIEKPVTKRTINMGIYMANQKILDYIPKNTFYGLNHLLLKLLALKQPIAVFPHRGKWMDIGTLKKYIQAQSYER